MLMAATVGEWVNVQGVVGASSLRVGGGCSLVAAGGAGGASPFSHVYRSGGTWSCGKDNLGGTVSNCLPTGNDNIQSVKLQCEPCTCTVTTFEAYAPGDSKGSPGNAWSTSAPPARFELAIS